MQFFWKKVSPFWIACVVLAGNLIHTDLNYAQEKVIFDTDIGPDWDDVGATATLHALANRGEAEILAMMVSSGGHSATWGPPCLDAFNTYYGRPDIPIGVAKNGPEFGSRYNQQIAEEFPQDLGTGNAWDAVELYRKILSEQPDSSVVIITTGFMTNIADVLKSGPDGYSHLTGLELVEKKVKRWSCMGGGFPSSGGEFNFNRDAAATKYAVENWPKPVLFSGFEIGAPIQTGAKLALTPPSNPVRRAYELAGGYVGSPHSSWDQTAVLAGVRDPLLYWDVQTTGYCDVSEDGSNEWRATPDKDHSYLIKKLSNAEMTDILDNLMADLHGLPSVKILSPVDGAEFDVGADITIETAVSDSDGQVVKVEFFTRSSKIGEVLSAPFHFGWKQVARGGYYLSAKVFDNDGNWTVSDLVKIFVGDFDKSCVGHWMFEDSAADSSAFRNDGDISGNPEFIAGKVGKSALQFSSEQDFVSISPSPDFSATSFTLAAWVKIPNSIPDGWRTIIEHNRGGVNWFGLWKSANGARFHFRWGNQGNSTSDFAANISPDSWYHVAGVFNAASKTARLYLDGKLDKTIQNADVPEPIDAALRIGLNMDSGEDFRGVIDDVRVYSRALSGSEINDLISITRIKNNKDAGNGARLEFYSLSNYPNPFNPCTTIRYRIPAASHVTIDVFDFNGRHVATLVSEKKQAGSHTTQFSGANLASGVYFYRITTEKFKAVKKMIFEK